MEYRLLGPLGVTRDGTPLELGPPKQRAVLAMLLLERGRVVSTDRLCEAVWGDDPPGNAMSTALAWKFGSAPKAVELPEKILDRVKS